MSFVIKKKCFPYTVDCSVYCIYPASQRTNALLEARLQMPGQANAELHFSNDNLGTKVERLKIQLRI